MILTAHDSLANAIESIKLGAFHFLSKPYAPEELLNVCTRALEQRTLTREAQSLRAEKEQLQKRLKAAEDQLVPVAISRRMREVEQLIARVAPSEANVLLTGESGVGKEVFAREIHRQSSQAGGPDGEAQLRRVSGEHDRVRVLRLRERRVYRRANLVSGNAV